MQRHKDFTHNDTKPSTFFFWIKTISNQLFGFSNIKRNNAECNNQDSIA